MSEWESSGELIKGWDVFGQPLISRLSTQHSSLITHHCPPLQLQLPRGLFYILRNATLPTTTLPRIINQSINQSLTRSLTQSSHSSNQPNQKPNQTNKQINTIIIPSLLPDSPRLASTRLDLTSNGQHKSS